MSEDLNQDILLELRKLRGLLLVVVVVTILGTGPAFYLGFSRAHRQTAPSWDQARTACDRQEFPEALSMAKALVASQPDYFYGHSFLGLIYQAMGDLKNAEAEYARAYELFPSEENDKNLAAIRKRIATGGELKLLPK